MAYYAIVRADNIVWNIAIADNPLNFDGEWIDVTNMNPMPSRDWTYENGTFTPPPAPPIPPEPDPIVTKVAMITRFTDEEFVGILTAAKTDVEIEGWYARFSASNTINLADSRTIAGVDLLVTKSLLTQDRATEILTDPVQPSERP